MPPGILERKLLLDVPWLRNSLDFVFDTLGVHRLDLAFAGRAEWSPGSR